MIMTTMNNIQEVIKRDKCIVPFCPEKIIEAVEKAEQATDQGITPQLAQRVLESVIEQGTIDSSF